MVSVVMAPSPLTSHSPSGSSVKLSRMPYTSQPLYLPPWVLSGSWNSRPPPPPRSWEDHGALIFFPLTPGLQNTLHSVSIPWEPLCLLTASDSSQLLHLSPMPHASTQTIQEALQMLGVGVGYSGNF